MSEQPHSSKAPRPRKRFVRILLIVAGSTLAIPVVAYLLATAMATSRWRDFTSRHSARLARVESWPVDRVSLAGEPIAGNAWDGYVTATKRLASMSGDEQDALKAAYYEVWQPGVKVTPEMRAQLAGARADVDPELRRMRSSATCRSAAPPLRWFRNYRHGEPEALVAGATNAIRFLTLSARACIASGDFDAAVGETACALQIACDVARFPCMTWNWQPLIEALYGLDALVLDARATPEQLVRLERILAAGEAQLLSYREIQDMEIAALTASYRPEPLNGSDGEFGQLWLYGFSSRLAMASWSRRIEESFPKPEEVEQLDYATAAERYQVIEDRWLVSQGRLVFQTLCHMRYVNFGFREVRARFRMPRAVLILRRGGSPSDPDWPADSFATGPLRVRSETGFRVVWSRYRYGKDGTQGTWVWSGRHKPPELDMWMRVPEDLLPDK